MRTRSLGNPVPVTVAKVGKTFGKEKVPTMSGQFDDGDEDDENVLELCALVEEYKEALEASESQNGYLASQVQLLQAENERLKESSLQQSGVIQRLDDSVNQLMEELEQKCDIIATKGSDLQSLQHCLSKCYLRPICFVEMTLSITFPVCVIFRRNSSPKS